MSKDITITVKKDGKDVDADLIFGAPLTDGKKKKTLKALKFKKSVANDYCVRVPIHIKGVGFEMGTWLDIDAGNKTEYVFEV